MTAPGARPPGVDDLRWQDLADRMQRSERGRLLAPDLDDRRWQDIVDEASALIDRYAPQWTDRNPSDIGMTLIELLAWLVESLIYRLNRVPEKNYIAFLNLLGVTRAPQVPARTLLTFTTAGGPVDVPVGTAAQTPGTEDDAPIVFWTDAALTVAAAGSVGAVRVDVPGQPRYTDVTGALTGPHPARIELNLADNEGVQICLAVSTPDPPPCTVDLYVEPFREPVDRRAGERIEWIYSVANRPDPDLLRRAPWDTLDWGSWNVLDVRNDGTAGLIRPGVVRLRVPDGADWTPQDAPPGSWSAPALVEQRALRWLGVRVTNDPSRRPPVAEPALEPDGDTAAPTSLRLRFDRLDLNTTTASNVGTITSERPERLGTGTGRPRQIFRLAHWPVYAVPGTDTPYDHVRITVAGAPWHMVEYLPDGAARCYLLDPVTGEITFGGHDPASGRGSVPAEGDEILAAYRYVAAGAAGNVPERAVHVLSTSNTGLTAVTNPVPAVHGADEEPIEEAKRRAPEALRHRGRAVTVDDYELIARAAAPGIAITRCLPPRLHERNEPGGRPGDPWTYGNLQRPPGVVNVIVVPDLGTTDTQPRPSLALAQDVIRALDRGRPVATSLRVVGPRYVKVKVRATVTIFPTAIAQGLIPNEELARAGIEQEIRDFLHPVHGRQGRGWQVGESVYVSDLYQAIRPAENVGFITSLKLAPEKLLYITGDDAEDQRPIPDTIGELSNQVRIADYELICPGTVEVTETGEGDQS